MEADAHGIVSAVWRGWWNTMSYPDPEPTLITDDCVARCETKGAANVLRSARQGLRLNRISSA
jgi:hypothetical protein